MSCLVDTFKHSRASNATSQGALVSTTTMRNASLARGSEGNVGNGATVSKTVTDYLTTSKLPKNMKNVPFWSQTPPIPPLSITSVLPPLHIDTRKLNFDASHPEFHSEPFWAPPREPMSMSCLPIEDVNSQSVFGLTDATCVTSLARGEEETAGNPHTVSVRATVVGRDAEQNAVLAGDPKRIRLLCNTSLITNVPSRRSKEERIRIHLQVRPNIQNNGYKR